MPGFWMLANGEKQGGVSIFFVNEEIDAGALCGQRIFETRRTRRLTRSCDKSKALAAELLLES